jgi:hypothetical protein
MPLVRITRACLWTRFCKGIFRILAAANIEKSINLLEELSYFREVQESTDGPL